MARFATIALVRENRRHPIKVIARVQNFHLALKFRVLNDLAVRRNPTRLAWCVVNEIARLAVHQLGRGHDRVDHGRNEAWQFRMLRDNLAGRLNRTATSGGTRAGMIGRRDGPVAATTLMASITPSGYGNPFGIVDDPDGFATRDQMVDYFDAGDQRARNLSCQVGPFACSPFHRFELHRSAMRCRSTRRCGRCRWLNCSLIGNPA